ncbi:F-box-like domain superfamily, partial [Arabidopsis thaliana x Arabidopsis arenosa]
MMMSNLPKDLVEEILSRVPFKYLRAIRSTCKNWNDISKTRSFANKHIDKAAVSGEKEFLMITQFNVFWVGINLHRSQNNNVDLSIELKAKLVSRDKTDDLFQKSQVIHCNCVFLCAREKMLVVLNPYWGKTKWIMPRPPFGCSDRYALGYDKSSGNHKILRLFGVNQKNLDVYDLSSSSWMVPDDVTLERDIYMQQGVSLKGDTYWYAKDEDSTDGYLLCFDFTRERFGPCLPLPLPLNEGYTLYKGYATLSVVKEEKLAVLLQRWDTTVIWVTNKIEPDAVSWSIFLKLDMEPKIYQYQNFFIDEEKKVAVVFDKDKDKSTWPPWMIKTIYNRAYIAGENGYFRSVDLLKSPNTQTTWPPCVLLCSKFYESQV